MAGWRDYSLVCWVSMSFLCGVPAVSANSSVPVAQAENAGPESPRSGLVAPGSDGVVAASAIEAAVRDDAARRWQLVNAQSLRVRFEDITWPDGSLGCPQPSLAYTQALVPGWRVLVSDGGREAAYHASRRGQWLLCQSGARPAPSPAGVSR